MTSKQRAGWAMAALMAGLVACDAGTDDAAQQPDTADRSTLSPAPTQVAPVDHSGITGSLVADERGDELTVTLALEGLEYGAIYSAYLHEGRCASRGPVHLPLGHVRPGTDGTATVRFRVGTDALPADQPASIEIRGETASGALACVNLLPHD